MFLSDKLYVSHNIIRQRKPEIANLHISVQLFLPKYNTFHAIIITFKYFLDTVIFSVKITYFSNNILTIKRRIQIQLSVKF